MAEVERSGSESEWHGFSSPGSVCGDLFAGGDVNSGSLLVSSFQSDALESTNSSLLGLTVPVRRYWLLYKRSVPDYVYTLLAQPCRQVFSYGFHG
jgi:hypothetical protein